MRLRNIPEAPEAIENSPICIQDPFSLKGQWNSSFDSDSPIFLEIGCGKGQFIAQMARTFPDHLFIGIETYASVLYRALKKAGDPPPENLRFLNFRAEGLPDMFAPGEIDGIYLNFSDPWPKDRHARRRLTSPEFLDRYAAVVKNGAVLEFKTDNENLYHFSIQSFTDDPLWQIRSSTTDLHHDEALKKGNVLTEYEERFLRDGLPICKITAQADFSCLLRRHHQG